MVLFLRAPVRGDGEGKPHLHAAGLGAPRHVDVVGDLGERHDAPHLHVT